MKERLCQEDEGTGGRRCERFPYEARCGLLRHLEAKRRRKGRRGRLGQCRAPPVELCALRTTGKITTVTSSLSVSDASETVLWCRCRQCGVAASPPHGDKQLPAVTTRTNPCASGGPTDASRRTGSGVGFDHTHHNWQRKNSLGLLHPGMRPTQSVLASQPFNPQRR